MCRYVNGSLSMNAGWMFEFRFRLTRESHHYVRADRSLRHPLPSFPNPILIVARPVFPMHPAKDGVRSGLQRGMDVLGNPRRIRHQLQQVVREIHRFH